MGTQEVSRKFYLYNFSKLIAFLLKPTKWSKKHLNLYNDHLTQHAKLIPKPSSSVTSVLHSPHPAPITYGIIGNGNNEPASLCSRLLIFCLNRRWSLGRRIRDPLRRLVSCALIYAWRISNPPIVSLPLTGID